VNYGKTSYFFRGTVFAPHPLSDKFAKELIPLLSAETEDARLLGRVEELAAEHGNSVYREMLFLMAGKHSTRNSQCVSGRMQSCIDRKYSGKSSSGGDSDLR